MKSIYSPIILFFSCVSICEAQSNNITEQPFSYDKIYPPIPIRFF
jgi:hypothetical protein